MTIWKTKWGWRAEFVHKGRRIMARGTFKYVDEAREWVKSEKEILGQNPNDLPKDEKDISLSTLSGKYLKTCKANYDKKTYDEKKYCLDRFYKEYGNVDVTDIEPFEIQEFLGDRAETQSNNAANKDRKNLKAFYKWVYKMHGVMYDPTGPIEKKSHTRKARRLIPIQDILKVMLMAKGHDRVLIGSYWHTGGRKSELLRWTWENDINFEERWVRLGTRKSRDRSMVYEKLWMNDDLYNLLMWQWKHRHPISPYVFCHMNPKSKFYGQPYTERRKTLNNLCTDAKVEPFGYHDIRHTVAKYLNDLKKVGLKKVQQVMRHQRQATTEIYTGGESYTGTKDVMTLLELENLEKLQKSPAKFPAKNKKRG
jgi:integrase